MKMITGIAVLFLVQNSSFAQDPAVVVHWNNTSLVSQSTAALQVVGNPMLRRSGSMHDGSFKALRDLQADYVRYVPWFPYPKLAVAELDAPTHDKTSWDFSLIDPMTIDFMEATKGHSVILNFSTIPQWLFVTDNPVHYPADPDQVAWDYGGGSQLRDTTMGELTDYYTRLISWYVKGGFTDELGKFHHSGYHYAIPYWEVFNESDFEHNMTPEVYTKRYDAIVTAIHKVSPDTKFVGMALEEEKPEWFEYFLNPAHHKPGVPLDMISYHCYVSDNVKQPLEDYQYALFDRADLFLNAVTYIESIRKRLSPQTKTDIDELGTFVNGNMRSNWIAPEYFSLSAVVYAYFFLELTKRKIDVIGESQLVGFPSQYPDVSMIDYKNNKPNPRYWVLKLIRDNFAPGDTLVNTGVAGDDGGDIGAQGFATQSGKKVLLFNKRNKIIRLKVPADWKGADRRTVDVSTGDDAPAVSVIDSDEMVLKPFDVSVITLK
jgi:hypothetical protein